MAKGMAWRSVRHVEGSVCVTVHRTHVCARWVTTPTEIQMAVSVAKARDTLQWFGGLYTCLVTGVVLKAVLKPPVPPVAFIPVVLGGFGLANTIDMAYGNKLVRVRREAEAILDDEYERLRLFVPPHQAPFHRMYGQELEAEKEQFGDVHRTGSYWPSFIQNRIEAMQHRPPSSTNNPDRSKEDGTSEK